MQTRTLTLLPSGRVIVEKAQIATRFFERLRGLLGRKSLGPDQALVIPSCNCVHMFFMRFAIDVVFCDAEGRILKIEEELRPWKISGLVHTADFVVELAARSAKSKGLAVGDKVKIS